MGPGAFAAAAVAVLSVVAVFLPVAAEAARIGSLEPVSVAEQAARFFSLRDPVLRTVLLGCILLGLNCGLLGGFIVVRRMALVGDMLSHAVLPGIALGFLWNMTKDPLAILVGATAVGLFSTVVVGWIERTTRLKSDAALGLVLSSFYAAGICLVTMIQGLPTGNKSGIDKFMFGQAAALGDADVRLMLVTTMVTLAVLVVGYRGFLVTSFDAEFARVCGLPVRLLHQVLMLLTAFAVVVAMQAVGVVLVSAMLVIPAASAYLLTDRLHRLLAISAATGVLTAVLGAFLSFLGSNLPTGPFMVLAGTGVFFACFLFAPRYGWLTRAWRQASLRRRTERENTLKAVYRILEDRGFHGEGVSVVTLAERRRETIEEASARVRELVRAGFATTAEHGGMVHLTPEGFQQAMATVRNHRLWELYLTDVANYEADHVHAEAEIIEHVLGEDAVRRLERHLRFPERDPHGRPIPSLHGSTLPGGSSREGEGSPEPGRHGYR